MCSSSQMRVEGLRWPATSWRFAGWSRPALACAVGHKCCWSFSATGRDTQPTTPRAIVVANGGGYGMGLAYAREMIHLA